MDGCGGCMALPRDAEGRSRGGGGGYPLGHHQPLQLPWGAAAAAKGCPPPAAPAAPAAASSSSSSSGRCKGSSKRRRSSSPELLRCKRRLAFPPGGGGGGGVVGVGGAASVARRNERERNRVKLVNLGFQALRQHVPNGAAAKKMSKVETLRSAVEYIRALQRLLEQHDGARGARTQAFLPAAAAAPPTAGTPDHHHPGPDGNASTAASGGSRSSVPGSPHSAYSSDESGYEGALSPEEQELLDFSAWFGSY